MQKKVDLYHVLNLLVNEGKEASEDALREFMIEKAKQIHESLMSEDDDALEIVTLDDDVDDLEDITSEIKDDADEIEDEEFFGEAKEDEDDLDGEEVDLETLGDEVDELKDRQDSLEAELMKLLDDMDSEDFNGSGEIEDEDDLEIDSSNEDEDADMDLDVDVTDTDSFDDEIDSDKEKVDEDDEIDFTDLDESWDLETVKVDGNGDEFVGAGGKVNVDKHSPLPNRKGSDRVGGKPVEIKASNTPKNFNREQAPAVKSGKKYKNNVSSATDNQHTVSKEGDKSSLLNKSMGSEGTKSPIGSSAIDLRGNDMRRK